MTNFSRMVLVLFYLLATGFLVAKRLALRWYRRRQRDRGQGLRHLLMIGGGAIAAKYLLALEHNPTTALWWTATWPAPKTRPCLPLPGRL